MNRYDAQLAIIKTALEASWSIETSKYRVWDPTNPSLGQCAVTALVIQDVFGGEIMKGRVSRWSHYWNVLPDGRELDLTAEQFGKEIARVGKKASKKSMLKSFETALRYELLKARVLSIVGGLEDVLLASSLDPC